MPNARRAVLKALDLVEKEGAYSNIALEGVLSESDFNDTDRRFISALFFGCLDRKLTLDYYISAFLRSGNKKIPITVLNALRIAVYQIKFMDKVPPFAAVNETVKLIKNSKYQKMSGFANAVLRNVLRQDVGLPKTDSISDLSVIYSCDESIIASLIKDYGTDTAKETLQNALKAAPVFLRVNTLKIDRDNLIKELKEQDILSNEIDFPNAIAIKSGVNIVNTKAYKTGLFHIEDLACQQALSYLDVKPGDRVLDTCSAPGGKTFTMAEQMQNKGEILACDIYPARLSLVEEGAERLGINIIKTASVDSGKYREMGLFDAILCDVPCSGIGVIRRKPEIKYRPLNQDKSLVETQMQILNTASRHLKVGGKILYSTCTLKREENEEQVEKFLEKHKDYKLEKMRTFLPHIDGTDGFFCALFIKSR